MKLRAIVVVLILGAASAGADEGMWTFDAFPSAEVKARYGFEPTQQWLDRVRLASVRLAGGCSASFVSGAGLTMTNHHCIRACVMDLSSAENDYLAKGFKAGRLEDEKRCPGVEANQLVEMTDVTPRLQAATKGLAGAEFASASRAEMSKIESACATGEGVRCDVVTLFDGAKYQLYKYRRFQDVRLVFAPEFSMAAFGGDADNFNFPRYGFDAAFLRVWDGGKPLPTPVFLPWAKEPAKEGDLVFISGHPGGTERQATVAQLEFQRDVALPFTLLHLAELRGALREYASGDAERWRTTRAPLRSVENTLKSLRGRHQALADPGLLARFRQREAELRAKAEGPEAARAWDEIAASLASYRAFLPQYRLLEQELAFPSELFAIARILVRAADELPKPSADRLREFSDGRLPQLRQELLSEAPIVPGLEQVRTTFGLNKLRETLGADDAVVRAVLGRESPANLARTLVTTTKLGDVAERQRLWDGGRAAIDASQDPFIVLARTVDAASRDVRRRYEDTVEAVQRRSAPHLAQARRVAWGTTGYPDATFTLRLGFGTVAGWEEDGRRIPALTTFRGAYERHNGQEPFRLPDTWMGAQKDVDPEMPLDMSTTLDSVGGNSGSPVIDRRGEVVGLVFDGNIHSLGGRFAYVPERNRAVAVHGAGLLHGLKHVYHADRVLAEIASGAVQAP
jgi:hypothetical protein